MANITAINREYALPRDTQISALEESANCKNLGLLLDKYQPWCKCSYNNGLDNWDLCMKYRDNHHELKFADSSEAKGYWLNPNTRFNVEEPSRQLRANDRFNNDLFEKFLSRYLGALPERSFPLKTRSRLIIGLGGKGTLEMGITLHHLYGFPYIPGSALKGLARSYGLSRIAEILEIPHLSGEDLLRIKAERDLPKPPLQILDMLLELPLDEKAPRDQYQEQLSAVNTMFEDKLKNSPYLSSDSKIFGYSLNEFIGTDIFKGFRAIFGTMGHAGNIIFYDAVPLTIEDIIVTEIMTPHFADYYQQTNFPQEDQSPKPLVYLAIREGIPFAFCLSSRQKEKEDSFLLKSAKNWLFKGLRDFGLGGKTSSGMGLFSK